MGVLRPLDALDVDALLHHLPQRAHGPEAVDVERERFHREVDLLLRRESTDTCVDVFFFQVCR